MKYIVLLLACSLPLAAQIRIGIVGTDTSHVPAFTAMFNDPNSKFYLPGARVVAAYKGGSSDLPDSYNRVEKFAEEIRTKYGVEIVPDIDTLCSKVDAVLLESVDGRTHLVQARAVLKHKKRLFIDKPLASTLEDARAIAQAAREAGVPWFSTSSLRYAEGLAKLRLANLSGVITWGPGPTEPHHQLDLAWYGIHAVEMLYALMGRGCEEVTMMSTPDADLATGRWSGGRLGTVRLGRPRSPYGAASFSPKEAAQTEKDMYSGYQGLVKEILQFFQTGKPPVPEEETLEMFAFMDAAQRSKAAGGQPMKLR
jgi:hypothetical protein